PRPTCENSLDFRGGGARTARSAPGRRYPTTVRIRVLKSVSVVSGTSGSNPLSSSAESGCEPDFRDQIAPPCFHRHGTERNIATLQASTISGRTTRAPYPEPPPVTIAILVARVSESCPRWVSSSIVTESPPPQRERGPKWVRA